MPRHITRWTLAAAMTAALALTGCSTGSKSLAQESYESIGEKITKGKTTKDEVRSAFGNPKSVSRTGNEELWVYHLTRTNGKLFIPVAGAFMSNTVATKVLTVTFNPRGIVKDYSMNEASR